MNTQVFQIQKHFPFTAPITRRMGQLMNLFGVTLNRLENLSFRHALDIELRPGDICYITGASGAGKSVMLRQMYNLTPPDQRLFLNDIPLERDKSLIDLVDIPLFDAVELLSAAGLADALEMLQTPAQLSAGQQFRYRLARALMGDESVIFADEFMSSVDTLVTAGLCRKLRNIATGSQTTFILAGVHDYFIPDLRPDVVVVKYSHGPSEVFWHNPERKKLNCPPEHTNDDCHPEQREGS